MIFGYFILRKISKFVATRCQIMKAKNAPNAISSGAPLQTQLTALSHTLLLDFRGLLLRKGRKGLGAEGGEESGKGKGRESRREGEDRRRERKGAPKQ